MTSTETLLAIFAIMSIIRIEQLSIRLKISHLLDRINTTMFEILANLLDRQEKKNRLLIGENIELRESLKRSRIEAAEYVLELRSLKKAAPKKKAKVRA